MEKININWAIYAADVNMLAQKIRTTVDLSKLKALIAVSRGGLVPATLLAHKLKIREVDTIDIRSYTDKGRKRTPEVFRTPDVRHVLAHGLDTIIVDDLIDTGDTLRVATNLLPNALVAVVYAKPAQIDLVNFFARQVPQSTWIEFPYE